MTQPEASLSRRIEQLAAAAGDGEGGGSVLGGPSALSGALAALRAEVGAVRADFASVRAELSTLRGDLDGVSSRIAGSLSSTRAEAGGLARRLEEHSVRLDALAGRVEDVRAGLPALGRDVREALSGLPEGAAQRLAGQVRTLNDAVAVRFETGATDLRRTLAVGLEQIATRTQAAEQAATDARQVTEARLAAVEDALGTIAERVEAFALDGSARTASRLDRLEQLLDTVVSRVTDGQQGLLERVGSLLGEAVDTLRIETRDSREVVTGALEASSQEVNSRVVNAVEDAVSGLGEDIAGSLDSFGDAVERAVGSVAVSTEQARVAGDAATVRLEGLARDWQRQMEDSRAATATSAAELRDELTGLLGEYDGFLRATTATLDSRLDAVRSSVAATSESLREQLLTELGELRGRVEDLADASAAADSERELAALRGDLADALEEVRDRVVDQVEGNTDIVRRTADELVGTMARLVGDLRASLLDRVEASGAATASRLAELATTVSGATSAVGGLESRLDLVSGQAERSVAELVAVREDWDARTAEALQEARDNAEQILTDVRSDVTERLAGLARAVRASVGEVRNTRDELVAGGTRMRQAAEALVAYLAERDRLLELDRDRMLGEVLEEFATGLSAKERRALASRVSEARSRRRDARDADRWRRSKAGEPPTRPAAAPGALAALAPAMGGGGSGGTTGRPSRPVLRPPATSPGGAPTAERGAPDAAWSRVRSSRVEAPVGAPPRRRAGSALRGAPPDPNSELPTAGQSEPRLPSSPLDQATSEASARIGAAGSRPSEPPEGGGSAFEGAVSAEATSALPGPATSPGRADVVEDWDAGTEPAGTATRTTGGRLSPPQPRSEEPVAAGRRSRPPRRPRPSPVALGDASGAAVPAGDRPAGAPERAALLRAALDLPASSSTRHDAAPPADVEPSAGEEATSPSGSAIEDLSAARRGARERLSRGRARTRGRDTPG